jgi:hypothetical protein
MFMPGCCCWTEAIVGAVARSRVGLHSVIPGANSATGSSRGASELASCDWRWWLALSRVGADEALFVMAGVDDSGCGWIWGTCERSRSCLARASWPKGNVGDGRRGWLVQNKTPSRRHLGIRVADRILMARSGGGNSGRCCRSTTESRRTHLSSLEVALSLAHRPPLGVHVMLFFTSISYAQSLLISASNYCSLCIQSVVFRYRVKRSKPRLHLWIRHTKPLPKA